MFHKVGVIYMKLSKAFDSLKHEFLIAKLKCYGLDQHAVEIFRSFLSNRYQYCKIYNTLRRVAKRGGGGLPPCSTEIISILSKQKKLLF